MLENIRTIKKIITGKHAIDGAGVKLIRVIGYDDTKEFDPFLMLDAFDSSNPDDYIKGFPWHPHRGIETITYLIEGVVEHGDSLGNKGSILNGECQWMTAGSGIIHQEMPKPADRLFGVQLWLNLPSKYKMTAPKYNGIISKNIPLIYELNSKVRIISGKYKENKGAVEGEFVKPLYLDVEVNPGSEWSLETEKESTLFIYILWGEGIFGLLDNGLISEKHAVLFNMGTKFLVRTSNKGLRFLLLLGEPVREPIAWGGPIVMNTQEELNLAFKELEEGNFIKYNNGE